MEVHGPKIDDSDTSHFTFGALAVLAPALFLAVSGWLVCEKEGEIERESGDGGNAAEIEGMVWCA